ncbi:MAG: T9SS type A sorting domain-containing protein [Bacteroidetes bacterium]|nr:T9SS type A sorting domain-containing protein [Bacteroidota bacterium]
MSIRSFLSVGSARLLAFAGLLFLLCAMPRQMRAQNFIGFYPPVLIGLPDTVSTGDSIIAGAVLGNLSPLLYNDTLTIAGYVDTGNGNVNFLYQVYPQAIINPFDTVPIIFQFAIQHPSQQGAFRIGGNVIVIWPILSDPQFDTGDSIVVPVFVLDGTGINENPRSRPLGIKCFPIPTRQHLNIEVIPGHPSPEYMLIRDVQGRIIYQSPYAPQPVNTEHWESGIYILECRYEDGSRNFIRIIR